MLSLLRLAQVRGVSIDLQHFYIMVPCTLDLIFGGKAILIHCDKKSNERTKTFNGNRNIKLDMHKYSPTKFDKSCHNQGWNTFDREICSHCVICSQTSKWRGCACQALKMKTRNSITILLLLFLGTTKAVLLQENLDQFATEVNIWLEMYLNLNEMPSSQVVDKVEESKEKCCEACHDLVSIACLHFCI